MSKNLFIFNFVLALVITSSIFFHITLAQVTGPLVGGRFAPGVFDIFTPVPFCGLAVSVVGPNPGVFFWTPTTFNYFNMTAFHVGNAVLGKSILTPPCGPYLFMYGSSLIP